jgi:hypothetical protein
MSHDWTYGAEHEWGDWAYNEPLPEGYGRDRRDFTCMSSNGIANDPKGLSYAYGGEINTPPTSTTVGQGQCVEELLLWWASRRLPAPTVNHRSNLHIHVRVPGLRDDLAALKRLQAYIHDWMPEVFPVIQPLPRPHKSQFPGADEYNGALRRWKRRRVSHQTLLTPRRLARQLEAETIDAFFRAEVPARKSDGEPQWHLQPRLCVNLRQLRDTDTIEFRHFAGTLNPWEVIVCAQWARDFLKSAFADKSPFLGWAGESFPEFPEYNHELERRYRATCHDGTLSRDVIESNIYSILQHGRLPHG